MTKKDVQLVFMLYVLRAMNLYIRQAIFDTARTAEQGWRRLMRLIDADAMLVRLEEWNTSDSTDKALYNFTLHRILEQPTIEPQPQRTGRWIPLQLSIAYPPYQCSCCFGNAPMVMVGTGRLKKGHLEALLTDFCPHCGARMEGAE